MANIKLIRRCILFLLALSFVLGDIFVGGRSVDAMESKELVKHKGTVKTIEVIKNIYISQFLSFILILDNLFLSSFFSMAIYFWKLSRLLIHG
jgi:hypothetical protein